MLPSVYLTVSVTSLFLAIGEVVSGLGLLPAAFKAGGFLPFFSALGFEWCTAGFHFSESPGVTRHDSVRSTALVSRSLYRLLTSLAEVSLISGEKLICLGLLHPSLSGIAGFPCRLTSSLVFSLLCAQLQAAEDSTVAGLVCFPGLSDQRVGVSSG